MLAGLETEMGGGGAGAGLPPIGFTDTLPAEQPATW
jgi:hypothetical protein